MYFYSKLYKAVSMAHINTDAVCADGNICSEVSLESS